MNKCPYCGARPCLPSSQKLSVGASGAAHCQECGRGVRVDSKRGWVVIVSMTLMIIALVSGRLGDPLIALILLVFWNSLTIVLYYAWLPLRRDPFAPREK